MLETKAELEPGPAHTPESGTREPTFAFYDFPTCQLVCLFLGFA